MKDCIFCKIVNGELPSWVVLENEEFISFLDVSPYGKGHTIVIPKEHYENFFDLPEKLIGKYFKFVQRTARKLREKLNCSGVNILNASGTGARPSVSHIHFHIVPRFEKDGMDMEPKKAYLWVGQLDSVLQELK